MTFDTRRQARSYINNTFTPALGAQHRIVKCRKFDCGVFDWVPAGYTLVLTTPTKKMK